MEEFSPMEYDEVDPQKELYQMTLESMQYNASQVYKLYDKIISSSVYSTQQGKHILEYFCYINQKPFFGLYTMLWLDTFHDFKEERLTSKGKGSVKYNKVVDYLCYKIYGDTHWMNLKKNGKKKYIDISVDVGHHYNIDKLYQCSFFEFDEEMNVVDFVSKDYLKHTVLKECYNLDSKGRKKLAKILYNVSSILIADDKFENDFLNAYLTYSFDFALDKPGSLLKQLKSIVWPQISEEEVPYYAKDVDNDSGNFLQGKKVVIPASLFDANKSNSSKDKKEIVNIKSTIIRYANGYDYSYSYNEKECEFKLGYIKDNITKTLTINKCEGRDNESIKDKQVATIIKKLDSLLEGADYYDNNNQDILNIIDEISRIVYYTNPSDKITNLQGAVGLSPIMITCQIIILLCKQFMNRVNILSKKRKGEDNIITLSNTVNYKSPIIQCSEFDFWVSLKRIGDYGQILQCRDLNIPLFTDDRMQVLISIVTGTSVIWCPDGTRVLWYDNKIDGLRCSNVEKSIYSRLDKEYKCDIKRKPAIYDDYIKIMTLILKPAMKNSIVLLENTKEQLPEVKPLIISYSCKSYQLIRILYWDIIGYKQNFIYQLSPQYKDEKLKNSEMVYIDKRDKDNNVPIYSTEDYEGLNMYIVVGEDTFFRVFKSTRFNKMNHLKEGDVIIKSFKIVPWSKEEQVEIDKYKVIKNKYYVP